MSPGDGLNACIDVVEMIDAPGFEVRERRPADPHHRVDVGAEHPVELLGRDRLEASRFFWYAAFSTRMSRPPSSATVRSTSAVAELLVAHVAGDGDGASPGRLDERGRGAGVLLLLGHVHDRDVRALPGERDRDGAPDAGVAAGDERARPSSWPLPT